MKAPTLRLGRLLATFAMTCCGCAGDPADGRADSADSADAGGTAPADAAGDPTPDPSPLDGSPPDDSGTADDSAPGDGGESDPEVDVVDSGGDPLSFDTAPDAVDTGPDAPDTGPDAPDTDPDALETGPDAGGLLQVSAPANAVEGTQVTFTAAVDGAPARHEVRWTFSDGIAGATGPSVTRTVFDEGPVTATARLFADDALLDTALATVEVDNAAPSVLTPESLFWAPGTRATLEIEVGDPGVRDRHVLTIDWGDGQIDELPVRTRRAVLEHAWSEVGSYVVTVDVRDEAGGSGSASLTAEIEDSQRFEVEVELAPWAAVGTPLRGRIRARSALPAALELAAVDVPDGLVLDASTGALEWTPETAGEVTLIFEVSDGLDSQLVEHDVNVSAITIVASATIDAAAGGTLEVTEAASPLLGVRLEVPAGALAADTELYIAELDVPPPDDGLLLPLGPAFELGPPSVVLAGPVLLSVPVDAAAVPTDAVPERARIHTWQGTPDLHSDSPRGWTSLPGAGLDLVAGRMAATLSHFSPHQPAVPPGAARSSWVTPEGNFRLEYDGSTPTGSAVPLHPRRPEEGYAPDPAATYDSVVPVYVQDAGRALEQALSHFTGLGYACAAAATPEGVSIRQHDGYGVAYFDGFDVSIELDSDLSPYDLRVTAAHELFHKCQHRSFGASGATQADTRMRIHQNGGDWIVESSAEAMALQLFPWPSGIGPNPFAAPDLLTLPASALSGYGIENNLNPYWAFPVFLYLDASHPSLMPVARLFGSAGAGGVAEAASRLATGPATQGFYELLAESLTQAEIAQLWVTFGLQYHLVHDPAVIPGIDDWLFHPPVRARPLGDEREDVPLLLPMLGRPNAPVALVSRGDVAVYGINMLEAVESDDLDVESDRLVVEVTAAQGSTWVAVYLIPRDASGPPVPEEYEAPFRLEAPTDTVGIDLCDLADCAADSPQATHDVAVVVLQDPAHSDAPMISAQIWFEEGPGQWMLLEESYESHWSVDLDSQLIDTWSCGGSPPIDVFMAEVDERCGWDGHGYMRVALVQVDEVQPTDSLDLPICEGDRIARALGTTSRWPHEARSMLRVEPRRSENRRFEMQRISDGWITCPAVHGHRAVGWDMRHETLEYLPIVTGLDFAPRETGDWQAILDAIYGPGVVTALRAYERTFESGTYYPNENDFEYPFGGWVTNSPLWWVDDTTACDPAWPTVCWSVFAERPELYRVTQSGRVYFGSDVWIALF